MMKGNYYDRATRSILTLDRLSPDHYRITRISVPNEKDRNKGIGSRLLRECIRDADIESVTLSLEPIPPSDNDEGYHRAFLIRWYQKYGFKPSSDPDEKGHIWVRRPTSHPLMREALATLPALTPRHLTQLAEACVDELWRRADRS
jgi:hypothetical protein